MVMAPEDTFPAQWTGQQARVVLPEHIDVSNAGQICEELLSVIDQGAEALIADMSFDDLLRSRGRGRGGAGLPAGRGQPHRTATGRHRPIPSCGCWA